MTNNGSEQQLDERSKSDKSLKSDRDKSNVLHVDANAAIDKKFDEVIESTRSKSDQELRRNRLSEDKLKAGSNLGSGTSEVEEGITKERDRADSARGEERVREDQLRRKERVQKSLSIEALLLSERDSADAGLFDEREVIDANSRLRDELAAQLQVSSKDDLAAKDLRLAIVSHDLRNPLGAISMSAGLICRSIERKDFDSENILKFARMIQRNASSMDRMVGQLLEVEKIAHGKIDLKFEQHEISEFCRDCLDVFSSVAATKDISLFCSGERDGIIVNCDYDRILQVLSNLVGNAIKFTPKGGKVEIAFKKGNATVEVSVVDNGPGIPEEAKSHIFDQFSQLRSNDRTGLGLGLYISKWLIEAHRGCLALSSEFGKGSTFSFSLPTIS